MDWKTAGQTIPEITTRDLVVFRLPPEEAEQLARQYNRAVFNINNDGADVAIISLKKIITEHPDWGEASLLFGICVAQCEEYHRALSCFEHALTCGLHSQSMTELAQFCLAQAKTDSDRAQAEKDQQNADESPLKALSTSIMRQESPMVAESENRERIHMQAPILIKAPKKPRKRRIATEKEIRDALAQSTSSNGEIPDEEIVVDFPKTPAEKMRTTLIVVIVIAALVGLFFLIKYVMIPVFDRSEDIANVKKIEYLESELQAHKDDPVIAEILNGYDQEFSDDAKSDATTTTETTTAGDTDELVTVPETTGEATAEIPVETAAETQGETSAETEAEA